MIVDTSAIVAIVRLEPDAQVYEGAIAGALSCSMSSASYFESAIVVDALRDPVASARLDDLFRVGEIWVEPFTEEQAKIARQAYRDFGRGSGHPANLNFGDCFSYALAKVKRQPLLYKGNDFVHTDVRPAVGP